MLGIWASSGRNRAEIVQVWVLAQRRRVFFLLLFLLLLLGCGGRDRLIDTAVLDMRYVE
jgi:hypothetical protein